MYKEEIGSGWISLHVCYGLIKVDHWSVGADEFEHEFDCYLMLCCKERGRDSWRHIMGKKQWNSIVIHQLLGGKCNKLG